MEKSDVTALKGAKDSLLHRLRRILLNTAVFGLTAVPVTNGSTTPVMVTPVLTNREQRNGEPRLIFQAQSQSPALLLTQHVSHSSHSSHASHYSGTSGTAPVAPSTPPARATTSTPAAPSAPPAPTPAAKAAAPAAATKPVAKAPVASTQKLAVSVGTFDGTQKLIIGKDEFGTEYKVSFTPGTQIVTVGTAGTTTKTISSILAANPKAEVLKKGQSISIVWEKQGTQRVALKVTILK